jgi:hypothetical protein
MLTVDDRKTWISTADPVDARLRLRPAGSVRSLLDGAWWPRSREPVTELTALIAALDLRQLPVSNLMLNAQAWDSHPRRIRVADRVIRLGWFASLDACLLIATTVNDQRVDLLVVAPDATAAVASAAMGMAADGPPSQRATDVVAAAAIRQPGQPCAEAVWESEGGGLGRRSGRSLGGTPEPGAARQPTRW